MLNTRSLFFALILLTTLLFAGCVGITGDDSEQPAYAYGEEIDIDIHGLISRVTYRDNAAYIFGSMHMGRASWYPLHDQVEAAMRRADVFAFETDISPDAQAEHATLAAPYMFLEDGTTLSDFLPPDIYEAFSETLDTYNVQREVLGPFTPWAISLLLMELTADAIGISPAYSVDFYVMGFALEQGLPILGLNPLAHEVSLAFHLSEELQRYAALALQDFDSATQQMGALTAAYEAQNIPQILYFTRESIAAEEETPLTRYMIDVLHIQRSVEFAQEIIRLLQETEDATTFFVSMGIGHLVGDDHGNVFRYLAEAGFEIVPLYR